MNNNTKVETAQKSQATNKKTSKVPTGKVTLTKETEARKKAREEQYRNFRINALRRRCKRMKFDDEKTEELVKKLIEQMNAPKEYNIIVMFNSSDYNMVKEAVVHTCLSRVIRMFWLSCERLHRLALRYILTPRRWSL